MAFRLRLEGMTLFSISPSTAIPCVAAFIPEKKGSPAQCLLFTMGQFDKPCAQKAFYRADTVQFYWNVPGTHLLVFTHTDVDNTGQSYYGETNLYYLSQSGNFDCRIDLDQPGPIHDVTWSPNGREFVVVYGTIPSKATLFDHRATPIFEFGKAARNTIKFNPRGRLLYIAGFGNLNGEIVILNVYMIFLGYLGQKAVKKIDDFSSKQLISV
jgi:translation initiation factor 2A